VSGKVKWEGLAEALIGCDVTIYCDCKKPIIGNILSRFSSETTGENFRYFDGIIVGVEAEGPDTVQTNHWIPFETITLLSVYP
jgi:hypothetical protein